MLGYQEFFQDYGGEKIQLVPSLNSNDFWVDAVKEIIDKNRLYK
jgi:protoheme ferro-lyase